MSKPISFVDFIIALRSQLPAISHRLKVCRENNRDLFIVAATMKAFTNKNHKLALTGDWTFTPLDGPKPYNFRLQHHSMTAKGNRRSAWEKAFCLYDKLHDTREDADVGQSLKLTTAAWHETRELVE